jgi:hypothetical protein
MSKGMKVLLVWADQEVARARVCRRPEVTCHAIKAGTASPGAQCRALITGRDCSPPA